MAAKRPDWKPYSGDRWREVEDAMWQIYATGFANSPAYVNVILEEGHAAALAQANAKDRGW